MADDEASDGPAARPALVLAVAAFGVFVAADDLMVVSTMLRPMADDLDLVLPDDLEATAWIVNVYLIAYLSVMPLAGRLSDVLGRRVVFVTALAVFLVGSLVVPAADSLAVLLVGRALTAIGGGALVPLALAVAGDLHRGAARARALGLLGAIETLGWVWGPLYGAVLVRFLSWRWQFHLNIPLAVAGMAAGWLVLAPGRRAGRRIGWGGTALLTVALVALSMALLGEARVQSATGLGDLGRGGDGPPGGRWLYLVAVVAVVGLAWVERRSSTPVFDREALSGRGPAAALVVNGLVGVGLVVALVNVPLFVNVVEGGVEQAAVRAGWLLTALTATMAAASYAGGATAGRFGHRPPVLAGLTVGAAAFGVIGWSWSADTPAPVMALHLAALGAGIGLVLAPTTAAVVDATRQSARGAAAAMVIVCRLIGFSVGLAALTAWGLRRYDELRAALELPPLGAPGYEDALADAAVGVTTTALGETFLGAGLAQALAAVVAVAMPTAGLRRSQVDPGSPSDDGRRGRPGGVHAAAEASASSEHVRGADRRGPGCAEVEG